MSAADHSSEFLLEEIDVGSSGSDPVRIKGVQEKLTLDWTDIRSREVYSGTISFGVDADRSYGRLPSSSSWGWRSPLFVNMGIVENPV
jgi:hypothetical protein